MGGKNRHRRALGRGWAQALRAGVGVLAVVSLVLQITLGAAHIHKGPEHAADLAANTFVDLGHSALDHADGADGNHHSHGPAGDADDCPLCLAFAQLAAVVPPALIALGAPVRMAPAQVHAFQAAVLARQGPSAHGTRAPPVA